MERSEINAIPLSGDVSFRQRAVEPERQGAVLGVGQSVGSLARVVGPSMAGFLFDVRLFLPYLAGAALIAVGTAIGAGLRQPGKPAG